MPDRNLKNRRESLLLTVILWGSLWGLFEATAGYILHLSPVNIGFLVWYPAACFFMDKTFNAAGKPASILYAAFLSASFKLLDLLLPVRLDRVLNPAAAIILEAFSLFLAIKLKGRLPEKFHEKPCLTPVYVLSVNTLWRLLYLLYIPFTPEWMISISVLRGAGPLIRFILAENLASSIVIALYIAYAGKLAALVLKRKNRSLSTVLNFWSSINSKGKTAGVLLLFSLNLLIKLINA